MQLILARHGNTFNPGDKICWVGSRNDLPLVEQGIVQAERVGNVLRDIPLSAIYHASLKRTRHFAEIVAEFTGTKAPLLADDRLLEIDYGQWSGLTDAEIAEKYGEKCLKDWVDRSVWPQNCGWSGSEELVTTEVEKFVFDVIASQPADANVLVVTSNGKLRYFLKLIKNEFEQRVQEHTFKVATGRICLLSFQDNHFRLELWNEPAESLPGRLVKV